MRAPPSPKPLTFLLIFCATAWAAPAWAATVCEQARQAWAGVKTYQVTYRAVTVHEGKRSESLMRYSYDQGKIRMDIEKPKKGAVLIYNPEVSPKVRVRPFPRMSKFVLDYALDHSRVSSGDGGTVDRSDLGHRIEAFCKAVEGRLPLVQGIGARTMVTVPAERGDRRWIFAADDHLPRKIELLDAQGEPVETFEWTDLRVNPAFAPNFFTKF